MRLKLTILNFIFCLSLLAQEIDFSVASGVYDEAFQLELSTNSLGEIHYTLDGSKPSAQSSTYTDPVLVMERTSEPNTISLIATNPPTTSEDYVWKAPMTCIPKARIVKAAVFKDGLQISELFYEEYFVGNPLTEIQLPIFSVQVENSDFFDYEKGIYVAGKDYDANPNTWQPGNYFERGAEWEKVTSLSYYEDQELVFRQKAQIQIHGGGSRIMPCKSLRISAKKSLGKKWFEHAFFQDRSWNKYKRLILRNAGQDWNETLFADVLLQSLLKDQGIEYQASKQVVLFVNGSYWGIHNLRERYDQYYFLNYHSGDEEDIDYLEIAGEFITKQGNTSDYELMNESLLSMDLSVPENYKNIADQIDITNYINHHISKVYGGGRDWSGNNERLWRPGKGQNKWRWVANDYDDAFKNVDYDSYLHATGVSSVNWPNPEWSTRLFRSLMTNEEFSVQYRHRLKTLIESTYSAENVNKAIDSLADLYRSEMGRQIERWSYPSSVDEWEQNIEDIKQFVDERPQIIWDQFIRSFPNIYDHPEEMIISPNPASEHFFIDLPYHGEDIPQVKILGMDGKEYYEGELSNTQRNKIDIQSLSGGVYIIQVLHGSRRMSRRLSVN